MKIAIALIGLCGLIVYCEAAEKMCEPGTTFQVDCNSCKCTFDGMDKICTYKECPSVKKRETDSNDHKHNHDEHGHVGMENDEHSEVKQDHHQHSKENVKSE